MEQTFITSIHLRKWVNALSSGEQEQARRLWPYIDRINGTIASVMCYSGFAACLIFYIGYFFLDGVVGLDARMMHMQPAYRALLFLGMAACGLTVIYYLWKGMFVAAMVLYFGPYCGRIGEQLGEVLATEPCLVPTYRRMIDVDPNFGKCLSGYLPST